MITTAQIDLLQEIIVDNFAGGGEAPAMHRTGVEYIPFERYDQQCCPETKFNRPEQCMWLQGKTRFEWEQEPEVY